MNKYKDVFDRVTLSLNDKLEILDSVITHRKKSKVKSIIVFGSCISLTLVYFLNPFTTNSQLKQETKLQDAPILSMDDDSMQYAPEPNQEYTMLTLSNLIDINNKSNLASSNIPKPLMQEFFFSNVVENPPILHNFTSFDFLSYKNVTMYAFSSNLRLLEKNETKPNIFILHSDILQTDVYIKETRNGLFPMIDATLFIDGIQYNIHGLMNVDEVIPFAESYIIIQR